MSVSCAEKVCQFYPRKISTCGKKANKTKNKKPRNITFNKNKIFTVGLFTKMFILAEKSDKNIESRIFKS